MTRDFWIETMRQVTGKLDKCSHGRYGYESCEQCSTEEIEWVRAQFEELKVLAKGAVEEFPVASGLYTDTDGQDGYGYLRALRLFLKESP
jgi:hypothetical protein